MASIRAVAVVALLLLCTLAAADQKYLVVHLTDVHGWINAHPHNKTLDADFGDFASLMEHLNHRCAREGVQLLLFDSGDIVEGTGISDATPIHGEYVFPIIEMIQNYTALTMGNHDIGHSSTVGLLRRSMIPNFNTQAGESATRYLTANSFAKWPLVGDREEGAAGEVDSQFEETPLGEQYTVRTGAYGQKFLVLGFMFNFTWEASVTDVEYVSQSVNDPWFAEAMAAGNDADIIFVPMHIDPQSVPEMNEIYEAIRSYHPDKPIAMLAGHRHRMYWKTLDPNAFVIESGKYFEEIGLIEFSIDSNGHFKDLSYDWLPTSVSNFAQIAGVPQSDFLTPLGVKIKDMIKMYSQKLHLYDVLGCSEQFYSPNAHYYARDSLYGLYINQIIPDSVFNASLPNVQFFVTNTAALRYPLFEGVVVVNDIWTIAPFKDLYQYYTDIPGSMLKEFLQIIDAMPSGKHAWAPYEGASKRILADFDQDDDSDVLPNYYWSNIQVQMNATYDLVMPQYDADQLQLVFQEYFPSYDSTFSRYPTDLTSTSALGYYVEDFMKCSDSCPC